MAVLTATGIATGAPVVGSPVIGQIHVLTATGVTAGAPVTGSPRLRPFVPWPFRPLPDSLEALSWQTDVMQSGESEMRVSLRPARQVLSYAYTLRDPRTARAEGLVRAFSPVEWLVPVWHEGTDVGALGGAETVLTLSTDADYAPGRLVVIWGGCDDFVIRQVASVGAGSIAITAPVGRAFLSARVMPAAFAWMTEAGLGADRIRERGVSAVTVSFLSREAAPEGATSFPQYLGLDLVEKCGVVEPLQASFVPSLAFIDSSLGPVEVERLRTPIDARYSLSWRIRPGALWQRRRWLHLIRGRDRAFWLADWSKDLTLQAATTSGATSILVAPVLPRVADYVGRHILIDDGIETPRQITTATAEGLNVRLGIGAAIGRVVPTTARIGFLRKVRLDSDTVEIAHRHGFVSTTRIPLIEVPE